MSTIADLMKLSADVTLHTAMLLEIAGELERRSYDTCRRCKGSGITFTERVVCGKCKGTGKTSKGKPCAICDGNGSREIDTVCWKCNGSGMEQNGNLDRAAQEIRFEVENIKPEWHILEIAPESEMIKARSM
jgi:DnaJ-class molecular chaperone